MAEGSGTKCEYFNNILGENEKLIFYLYLKTKGTFWSTQYYFDHLCSPDSCVSLFLEGFVCVCVYEREIDSLGLYFIVIH